MKGKKSEKQRLKDAVYVRGAVWRWMQVVITAIFGAVIVFCGMIYFSDGYVHGEVLVVVLGSLLFVLGGAIVLLSATIFGQLIVAYRAVKKWHDFVDRSLEDEDE